MKEVIVKYHHPLPKLIRVNAITLYPYVFVAGGYNRELINHEFVHVNQVRRAGWFRFYVRYLYDYLRLSIKLRKHAYFEIPAEIEAFATETTTPHPALAELNQRTSIEVV